MKSKPDSKRGVVYSTESGEMCPDCGKPVTSCFCHNRRSGLPNDGIIRVSRETKGRKGSGVTVISGIPLDEASIKSLAKQLKKKCGTGGTVKSGIIEIQGDQRDKVMEELSGLGYQVKRSGG